MSEVATQKVSNKKKKLAPKKTIEKKERKPKTINSRSLLRFDSEILLAVLLEFVERGEIPNRKWEGIHLKSIKRPGLLVAYPPPWATANVYQRCYELKKERQLNEPVLDTSQTILAEKLEEYSNKILVQCVRDLQIPDIKFGGIKKAKLINSIVLAGKAKNVVAAAAALRDMQEDIQKAKRSEMVEEEDDSPPPKKKTKKVK